MTCFPEIEVVVFFNLPLCLPPPRQEQRDEELRLDRGPTALFLWGRVVAETPAPGELLEGGCVISEILGENPMPALLLPACCRLQETKLPFYLVYAN